MLINFEDLKTYDFSLTEINAIFQKPAYRVMNVGKRRNNGLLYISSGKCKYTFDSGEFTMSEGSLAYLPIGGAYTLTVTCEPFENYRTNFMLKINDEFARFSDVPIKLTDHATPECVQAIRSLEEAFRIENNTIIKTEKLCRVFSFIQKMQSNSEKASKLDPAIRYMHEYPTAHFDSKKLASLCFLSIAQFYNLFHLQFNQTPLEYKNKLLLDHAVLLFDSYGISVTETASMLGFESPAYFSRFFKKHMGISPREYIKNCQ